MAIKHRSSFSPVFLATATIFLASETAANVEVCQVADYKPLCRLAVKGITDPVAATEAAIQYAIRKTRHARVLSRTIAKKEIKNTCMEMYDDAVDDLQEALQNLKDNDKGTLNSNLSAAITNYVTCEDAFAEACEVSPLRDVNQVLQDMVDNSLSLVTHIH